MTDFLDVFLQYGPLFLRGLRETAWLTGLGTLCALAAAILLHAAGQSRWLALRALVRLYTEFILGFPILVLLYGVYFVAPDLGLRFSAVSAGVITLTLYYSPYMAEAIRGAVGAVPRGQIEAGHAIGMGPVAIALRIVLPQAGAVVLPALVGLVIGLAKDTAILSIISVRELSYFTKQVVSRTFMPFEVWAGVAALYWICLSALELAMRRLESHLTRYRRPTS